MTAKEMFEELGYKQKIEYFRGERKRILYVTEHKYNTQFMFDVNNKMFNAYFKTDDGEEMPAWIEIKHLKAINKQIEELGWNNENNV